MSGNLNTASIDKKRWLVLVLQMLVGSVTAYVYNLTIYIGPFAEQKGWDPTVVVLVWTIMMVVGLPGSLIGGKLNAKFGSKFVLKVGGIAFGLAVVASSFSTNAMMFVVIDSIACLFMYVIYVSQLANVGSLFPDKSGLATGLFIGATSVGTAAMAPMIEWLTRAMDLMHGIALQGVVYGLIVIVCGFIVIEAPEGYLPANMEIKIGKKEEKAEAVAVGRPNYTVAQILKQPAFWLLILGVIFGTAFVNGMSANMSMVAQNAIAVSAAGGALFYSLWQVASGTGGIIFGFVSDKWFGPVKTFMLLCIVCGIASIALVAVGVSKYAMFAIVIVVIGLGSGGVMTLIPNTSMQVFGEVNFGFTYGVLVFAGAGAALIGTQVTTRCTPVMTFTLGAALFAVGVVLFFLITLILNRQKKTKQGKYHD